MTVGAATVGNARRGIVCGIAIGIQCRSGIEIGIGYFFQVFPVRPRRVVIGVFGVRVHDLSGLYLACLDQAIAQIEHESFKAVRGEIAF